MQAESNAVEAQFAADLAARYVVEREIGRGGSAVVFLARDRKIRRRVALKVLAAHTRPADAARRFRREIEMVGRLQHPHILALYDSGEAGGALYFAMPYVEGVTLRARLVREGALPPVDALRIAGELAEALAYAHASGVVHRDIKPENVLLSGYTGPGTPTSGGPARWHTLVCDFGIARWTEPDAGGMTLDSSGERGAATKLTRAGHAVGTPAYMAPEQVTGDPSVDSRVDVWSLGVVLYEMLAGTPPHADAPTPGEALRRRLTIPTPQIGARVGLSASVARAVDAILRRALALDPAERYHTVDAFGADVRAAAVLLAGERASRGGRRVRLQLVAAGTAVLAVVAAAGVWAGLIPGLSSATGAADPALVVVLPFADERTSPAPAEETAGGARPPASTALDGRDAEQLLLDAMTRWTDLRVVNATRVNDALTRRGIGAPRSLAEAVAIARELGAGRLAWGTIARAPRAESGERTAAEGRPPVRVAVRAALYDVARPDSTRREHTIRPAIALDELSRGFAELADSLLLGTARSRLSVPGALGTTSLGAWRAYDRGHDLLARWDLDGAAQAFGEAAALDPEYALAHRWRAQAYAWMLDAPRVEWQRAATRATALAQRMAPADGEAARALAALADGRYPDACRRYLALVRRDSMDFASWYGLGDCQAKDSLVVRDPASPSGWRFRSSYRGAIDAYRRVLSSVPSVHLAFGGRAVTYLPRLLMTSGTQWRAGYAVNGGDTTSMAALPAVNADTLAFTPYPRADHAAARPWTMPTTTAAALASNRRVLLDVAERWADAFPRSVDAAELRAVALESLGRLANDGGPGALDVVRAARLHAPRDSMPAMRLGLAELRLLVKLQRFVDARVAAERMMADVPTPTPATAAALAVANALIGRANNSAALLRIAARDRSVTPDDELPAPVGAGRAALAAGVAYASLGAPHDSVVAARDRGAALLTQVGALTSADVRAGFFRRLVVLSFPELHEALPDDTTGWYLLVAQRAAARGHADAARTALAAVARRRASVGIVATLDAVFQEAWLQAWAGDTATAIATLGGAIGQLPNQNTHMLDDVPRAAAVGRALALRARLVGHDVGDTDARRAASAGAAALWRDADASVLRANGVVPITAAPS